jgi:glycosyltransferase involved in cell wall biosynthesis
MTDVVDRKAVIVSLTPLPLSADSRTLKQVTSVQRFGFKSIAIEGTSSQFGNSDLPFEVIPVRPAAGSTASDSVSAQPGDGAGATASSCPSANERQPIHSLSMFRRSPFWRVASKLVPGSRKVAVLCESILDRTIASRRSIGSEARQVSTGEVAAALPFAVLRVLRGIVRIFARRIRPVVSPFTTPVVEASRRPLAFARHVTNYFDLYFFSVLAVVPRADLYYLHSFYQFPAVFLLCLRHRAKMIYDAHDFYQHQKEDPTVSSYWKNWVMPFEAAIEWACVRFAADVVTVNEGIAALMRERFRCKPLILRNAHDFRMDRKPARTIREVIGLPPDAFLIVSIGNYKSGITIEAALNALASLPKHVHLAFLGARYPSCAEAIKARGIDGRVHFVPPVLPQEVVPFAASADVAILLYFERTVQYPNILPNGFFQSVAAGLPLVYPNLEQLRRVAERYNVGLMADAQDSNEIRSALEALVEDAELRASIRRNLEASRRELCWEHEEEVLRSLFNRHLGRLEQPFSRAEDQVAH